MTPRPISIFYPVVYILITGLLIIPTTKADLICPRGGVLLNDSWDGGSNEFCLVVIGLDTFYAAELTCTQMGGHLPSIHSAMMNSIIMSSITAAMPCSNAWIGYDIRQQWFDQTPTNFTRFDPDPPDYSNFTCMMMTSQPSSGKTSAPSSEPAPADPYWITADCNAPAAYACALRAVEGPTTTVAMTSAMVPTKSHTTPPSTYPPSLDCQSIPQSIFIPRSQRNDVISAPKCSLGGQKSCSTWSHVFMVALSGTSLDEQLESTKAFIKQVVSDCDSHSYIALITPYSALAGSCNFNTVPNVNTMLNNVSESNFVVSDPTKAASTVVEMVQTVYNCYSTHQDKVLTNLAVYFISSLSCGSLCAFSVVNQQAQVLKDLTSRGANTRFIFYANDTTASSKEVACYHSVFNGCNASSYCYIVPVETSGEMEQWSHTLATCPKKALNQAIIGIIVSVVIAILILACCAYRCYRRSKGGSFLPCVGRNERMDDLIEFHQKSTGRKPKVENDYKDPRNVDGWEIDSENLVIKEQLGSGAFAAVYAGELAGEIPLAKRKDNLKLGLKRDTNGAFKVAVKKLPPHVSDEGRTDFMHEIDFMKNLGYHPHIMSLLGCVSATPDPLIVIELCQNGDLLSYIRSKKEKFTRAEETLEFGVLKIKDLISLAWQITDGMAYLTANNFIHRDIAARNILLTSDMTAKIGDFGLCRLVDTALYNAKGGRLPIKWMAPESLKYYEYSFKSDVWSFGVLLFEVFSLGETPYQYVQPSEMREYLEKGNRMEQPLSCPNEIYQIMKSCWTYEIDSRPSIDEIRSDLTEILNSNSESYGYLSMEDRVHRLEQEIEMEEAEVFVYDDELEEKEHKPTGNLDPGKLV